MNSGQGAAVVLLLLSLLAASVLLAACGEAAPAGSPTVAVPAGTSGVAAQLTGTSRAVSAEAAAQPTSTPRPKPSATATRPAISPSATPVATQPPTDTPESTATSGLPSVMVTGRVKEVTTGARTTIVFDENVHGFTQVVVTRDTKIVSSDEAVRTLQDIAPGMTIQASGAADGESGVVATEVRIISGATPSPGTS